MGEKQFSGPLVIVVVAHDYADHLERVARLAPVWIVATEANRAACERLWRTRPHPDHREKGAITSYNAPNPEDGLESLLSVIPDIETHHGEVVGDEFAFADGFVLEVIGLELATEVEAALREFGFASFVGTAEGFQARK